MLEVFAAQGSQCTLEREHVAILALLLAEDSPLGLSAEPPDFDCDFGHTDGFSYNAFALL